jgi:hypothetical protein
MSKENLVKRDNQKYQKKSYKLYLFVASLNLNNQITCRH